MTGAVVRPTAPAGEREEVLLPRKAPRAQVRCERAASAPPALYAADLGECELLSTLKPEKTIALFVEALERSGGTIVQTISHVFPGKGLTCALILRESHALLHTWPETGTINIDIFSCSTRLKSREAIDDLSRSFGARRVSVREIPRADGHSRQPEPGR